ncbi:uncharacterized protein [Centruroides vittatus]|uniref:uncharacterized protein n=1 Tax=Centruroides vittatus TaxID=120091 RepID=UPI003510BEDA
MNCFQVIAIFCLVIAVRSENECKCYGTVLDGSHNTTILTMSYPNTLGCDEASEIACKEKCATRFSAATNEGDLNARPPQLGGMTLGAFVCVKVNDVSNAMLTVYAQVCQSNYIDTGIKGKELICCTNKQKHDC